MKLWLEFRVGDLIFLQFDAKRLNDEIRYSMRKLLKESTAIK